MTDTRAPTTDFAHSPAAERARMEKACELEEAAVARGFRAADVARDDIREQLLVDLAARRGKRRSQVHASVETWRIVWRLLHDRFDRPRPADPFAGLDAAHDPFGGGAR